MVTLIAAAVYIWRRKQSGTVLSATGRVGHSRASVLCYMQADQADMWHLISSGAHLSVMRCLSSHQPMWGLCFQGELHTLACNTQLHEPFCGHVLAAKEGLASFCLLMVTNAFCLLPVTPVHDCFKGLHCSCSDTACHSKPGRCFWPGSPAGAVPCNKHCCPPYGPCSTEGACTDQGSRNCIQGTSATCYCACLV